MYFKHMIGRKLMVCTDGRHIRETSDGFDQEMYAERLHFQLITADMDRETIVPTSACIGFSADFTKNVRLAINIGQHRHKKMPIVCTLFIEISRHGLCR